MISVKEAKNIVENNVEVLSAEILPLSKAAGLMLAENIVSEMDFPPFLQSSMDGYAFCFNDWKNEPLLINGEMQAGSTQKLVAGKKEAVRIFTGAPLPEETDTVIMQEKVTVENGYAIINDPELKKGSSVRQQGAEMLAHSVALEKGTFLTPGAIGFIAGLGKKEVSVIRKPAVAIIVTGKELQQPGNPLQYGQVYESNSFALFAALQQLGVSDITIAWSDDDLPMLTRTIGELLEKKDLVLLCGGVSVGEYDFVTKALEDCGVKKLFHKIKQRPGKPLFFGKKEKCIIFGLPGNPSSVLTCFYEYVLIALQQLMGLPKPFLSVVQLPLSDNYEKKEGLQHFLKGKQTGSEVFILDAQESYRMQSFAISDCLVVLEENRSNFTKGELVEVHLLSK